jgi:hypothetical protein
MSSSTVPVEWDDPISEWEVLRPYTRGGDREGLSLEGDRRVSDREALALLAGVSDAFSSGWPLRHAGEVRWELDGSYYLG